ncbi:MAG: crosslink repair DNA glycosylase YcaQ family protein, partial [Verrucomicrobiota bacterium]
MSRLLEQFRKRVIRTSLYPKASLPKTLQRMGFVQADPIRSPARAQDLILRQRVKNYKAGDLEAAYPKLPLEEYFLFAYGIGSQDQWKQLHPKTNGALDDSEKAVLEAIREHGSMHPRTLESLLGSERRTKAWGGLSRNGKLILDSLHDRGVLRVQRREKGIRIYEVASPQDSSLTKRERFREIVLAAIRSMGPSSRTFLMSELRHFAYLEEKRSERLEVIEELIRSGRLRVDRLGPVEYLSLGEVDPSRLSLDKVRILAPFDPIVRDRARFEHLWRWEYRFEAYTPPSKRKLGYYAMPVLWRDEMIGWANAKVTDGRLS